MWNNQYAPPGGAPPFPGAGYAPPPQGAGWAPPPGPPPPSGPGIGGFQMPSIPSGFGMPSPGGFGAPSPYPPPAGPPPPSAPGWGTPQASPYAPPSGPPARAPASPYVPPAGPPAHSSGYPGQYHPPAGPKPIQAPPAGTAHMPPSGVQNYGPQYQGGDHKMHQPFFQYSQCNGRKKALLIGINYTGTRAELRGCHNDAKNLQTFLIQHHGYKREDMVMLLDGVGGPREQPTKANILAASQWLVRDAKPNDSLFFHFSGHGGQSKDRDGDEVDGHDETIYPVDFERAGQIVDDELHTIMVQPLPAGCRLTSIFDCCHSGSALDLPYIYSTAGLVKQPNLAQEAAKGLFGAVTSYASGDKSGAVKGLTGLIGLATGKQDKVTAHAKKTKTSPADVISWSGCKDTQTSADTSEAGKATGAMSHSFVLALSKQPQQTYQQLLVSIREILSTKYSQKPQLSSSHPMDVNVIFIC